MPVDTADSSSSPTTTATEDVGSSTGTTDLDPTTGGGALCGDSAIDPGEQCDSGASNGVDGNVCKADCTLNTCGDGYVATIEGCDDGNAVDDDDCSNACVSASCGDGVMGVGEECDDGNIVDDPECTALCKLPFCGDSYVLAPEECDLGTGNGDDQACTLLCVSALCGDGLLQTGVETCDDGNVEDADGCSSTCTMR